MCYFRKIFITLLMGAWFSLSGVDTLSIASPIHSVLLYTSTAEVQRSVALELSAGLHYLKIPRVSARANPSSIRVSTPPGLQLNKVKLHEASPLKPQNFPRLQKVLGQVEKGDQELNRILARREGVRSQMKVLQANQRQDFSNSSQLEERVSFYGKQMSQLKSQELRLKQELEEAREKRENLKEKLRLLKRELKMGNHYWLLQVEQERPGKVQLSLRYLVHAASWRSQYRATLPADQDSLHLRHQAIISQQTGVDWKDVNLSLALGKPLNGIALNPLPPTYIGAPPKRSVQKSQYNREKEEIDGIEVSTSTSAMRVAPKLIERSTFRIFELSRSLSLTHDGDEERRTLRNYKLPAIYRYESHPVQRPLAFLQAQIFGFGGLPLPRGHMKLYHKNTYVGSRQWKPALNEDSLKLSMGRDSDIVISREQTKRYTDHKRLSGNKEVTVRHEITIKNRKSSPIFLIIREPIPLPRSDKVSVERLEGEGTWKKDQGQLVYRLELTSGETKKLQPGYRVKAPEDFPLNLP